MTTATPASAMAEDFAATWADDYPRDDDSTNATRRSMIRVFGVYFQGRVIGDISRADARRFALAHPGHVRYARECLSDAVGDGLAPSNPFEGIRVRGRSKGRSDVLPPTVEEVATLYDVAAQNEGQFCSMIEFAAYTGVRLGEQLALRYCDIGKDRAQVLRQRKPDGTYQEPKTGRTRVIWNPPHTGLVGWDSEDLVWDFSRGQHFRRWDRTRNEAGLPDLDWHGLRHFCATWLLDQGCSPEDVAVQLGHTDGGIEVRRRYGHPDPEKALERLAERAG